MFKSQLPDDWREAGALRGGTVEIIDLGLARSLCENTSTDAAPAAAAAAAARADALPQLLVGTTPESSAHGGGIKLDHFVTPESSAHDGVHFKPEAVARGSPKPRARKSSKEVVFVDQAAQGGLRTEGSASPGSLDASSRRRELEGGDSSLEEGDSSLETVSSVSSWHGGAASLFNVRARSRKSSKEVMYVDLAAAPAAPAAPATPAAAATSRSGAASPSSISLDASSHRVRSRRPSPNPNTDPNSNPNPNPNPNTDPIPNPNTDPNPNPNPNPNTDPNRNPDPDPDLKPKPNPDPDPNPDPNPAQAKQGAGCLQCLQAQ